MDSLTVPSEAYVYKHLKKQPDKKNIVKKIDLTRDIKQSSVEQVSSQVSYIKSEIAPNLLSSSRINTLNGGFSEITESSNAFSNTRDASSISKKSKTSIKMKSDLLSMSESSLYIPHYLDSISEQRGGDDDDNDDDDDVESKRSSDSIKSKTTTSNVMSKSQSKKSNDDDESSDKISDDDDNSDEQSKKSVSSIKKPVKLTTDEDVDEGNEPELFEEDEDDINEDVEESKPQKNKQVGGKNRGGNIK